MPTYATAIFGSCTTCFAQFGHVYDADAIDVQTARAALGEKIEQCAHDGVGAKLL